MVIPLSFAKDGLRGVEAARQCGVHFWPVRPKGSVLGDGLGKTFSSVEKELALLLILLCDAVVPGAPDSHLGHCDSKAKARMLRIARGQMGSPDH